MVRFGLVLDDRVKATYARGLAAAIRVIGPTPRADALGMLYALRLSEAEAAEVLAHAILHGILDASGAEVTVRTTPTARRTTPRRVEAVRNAGTDASDGRDAPTLEELEILARARRAAAQARRVAPVAAAKLSATAREVAADARARLAAEADLTAKARLAIEASREAHARASRLLDVLRYHCIRAAVLLDPPANDERPRKNGGHRGNGSGEDDH